MIADALSRASVEPRLRISWRSTGDSGIVITGVRPPIAKDAGRDLEGCSVSAVIGCPVVELTQEQDSFTLGGANLLE